MAYDFRNAVTELIELIKAGDLQAVQQFAAWTAVAAGTDEQGRTPLHHAAHYGRDSIATELIDAWADVDAADKQGVTPLHLAAVGRGGKTSTVQLLLDAATDACRPCKRGMIPLHLATGCTSKVCLLIEAMQKAGASLDIGDRTGIAAL